MMMNQQTTFVSSINRMEIEAEPNKRGKRRTSKAMKIEAKSEEGTFTCKLTKKCHKQRS